MNDNFFRDRSQLGQEPRELDRIAEPVKAMHDNSPPLDRRAVPHTATMDRSIHGRPPTVEEESLVADAPRRSEVAPTCARDPLRPQFTRC